MDLTLKTFLAQSIYSCNSNNISYDIAIGGYDNNGTEYLDITDENKEKYGNYIIYSLEIFNNDDNIHIRIELTNKKIKEQND